MLVTLFTQRVIHPCLKCFMFVTLKYTKIHRK